MAWHSSELEEEAERPFVPSIEHAWLEYGQATIQKTSGAQIEIGRGQNYGPIGLNETIRVHRLALRSFTRAQVAVIHEIIDLWEP